MKTFSAVEGVLSPFQAPANKTPLIAPIEQPVRQRDLRPAWGVVENASAGFLAVGLGAGLDQQQLAGFREYDQIIVHQDQRAAAEFGPIPAYLRSRQLDTTEIGPR